jgi:hypothetical protein
LEEQSCQNKYVGTDCSIASSEIRFGASLALSDNFGSNFLTPHPLSTPL